MLNKKINKNNNKIFGTGLDISVNGMSLIIQAGTFTFLTSHFIIPETQIDFEVLNNERLVNIYFTESSPHIECIEEIGKIENQGEIINPLFLMANFIIPANTTDLSAIDINYWHYEDVEKEVVKGEQPPIVGT